ncbi:MAG: sodium:proton antiporter [Thermodesulfobacteriota bacterium]|nr:sodium:proton antiporter [Thermodesulfobacteriota bacterium]
MIKFQSCSIFPLFLLFFIISFFVTDPVCAFEEKKDMHTTIEEYTGKESHLHESKIREEAIHHHDKGHEGHHESNIGKVLPLWSVIPFVGILLSIAIFPLAAPHFWHHHFSKISAFWALIFAVPFVFVFHGEAIYEILHIYIIDYIPFIILLWGLYTVAGGIVLTGTINGTPVVNTIILLIGTLLASWVGTTGAAMILIRPLLRAIAHRKKKAHVVCFFIFLVANIGGSLTPLGDPPLFLGFLHGVPFFWTFNLLPHMLLVSFLILIVFFIVDSYFYRKEKDTIVPSTEKKEPIAMYGWHNFVFLGGIVGAVLMSGYWRPGEINIFGVHEAIQNLLRDVLIILMGILSLITTKKDLRQLNEFTWFPIQEVAYLFAGIFMTIIPALAILKAGSEGALAALINAVKEPSHYFWITGILSSFLDNAPTYLTFFNSALGKLQIPESSVPQALGYVFGEPGNQNFIVYLKAISAGAVFMGANTYIGNAPNFMVKSIAEEQGIPMPSFFGYMFLYSIPILTPLFIIVTFVFF